MPDLGRYAKFWSLALLVLAEVAGMTLWFSTAAILPALSAEFSLSAIQAAMLSSAVQAGFVIGALGLALSGLPDRVDARRLFAASALLAAALNAYLLLVDPSSFSAVVLRGLTGAALAGVYPVGIRLAAAWGERDRGLLVGLLVGALTLGSALPYLLSYWVGSFASPEAVLAETGVDAAAGLDWRRVILATSLLASGGAGLVLATRLGPYLSQSSGFRLRDLGLAWRDRRLRAVYLGYLGHMAELYAMWAWLAVALTAGFGAHLAAAEAKQLALLVAFAAITAGAIGCVLGGILADRIGRARVAAYAMAISGTCALLTGATLGGPICLTCLLVLLWGLSVIPDSPQFSALVADYAPAHASGSLLTLQTALGFALTAVTVQAAPLLADHIGWSGLFMFLGAGPAFGLWAMRSLK